MAAKRPAWSGRRSSHATSHMHVVSSFDNSQETTFRHSEGTHPAQDVATGRLVSQVHERVHGCKVPSLVWLTQQPRNSSHHAC